MRMDHLAIWNRFCDRFEISTSCIPLFELTDSGHVLTKEIGHNNRKVLRRSQEMEELICREVDILVEDWSNNTDEYDGAIYMMFRREGDNVLPLYIGKAETIGRGDRNLSANIKNLHKDQSKFARWGDNYAYHIGDLSAVVLPGHDRKKVNNKYIGWAKSLFVDYPSTGPKLKESIYFWMRAWRRDEVGIWEDFGQTRLTFLEYLLIGVASSVFPKDLLNIEGQNRG